MIQFYLIYSELLQTALQAFHLLTSAAVGVFSSSWSKEASDTHPLESRREGAYNAQIEWAI